MDEDVTTSPEAPPPEGPKGLGGWLWLSSIGLCLNLLILAFTLFQLSLLVQDPGTAAEIAARGIDIQDPAWGRLVHFEIWSKGFLLCYDAVLLVLFFTRSYWFPRAFIAFLGINLFIKFLELMHVHGVASMDTDQNGGSFVMLIRPVIYCVAFIPYYLQSARVRNTFVNHMPKPVGTD